MSCLYTLHDIKVERSFKIPQSKLDIEAKELMKTLLLFTMVLMSGNPPVTAPLGANKADTEFPSEAEFLAMLVISLSCSLTT